MPSPFPGMDPFLEKPSDWHSFHQAFCFGMQVHLIPQIRPRYIAKTDEHVFLHELSAEERLSPHRRVAGVGDTVVKAGAGRDPSPAGAVAGVIDAPSGLSRLPPPAVEEVRLDYLTLRDRDSREVVTVLELLSPSNKNPGADRAAYLAKRERLLLGGANLVEIDLLRGGPATPLEDPFEGDFRVAVTRPRSAAGATDPFGRHPTEVWVWRLRDRMPKVPVPLRAPDPDAVLDLRAVFDRVYEDTALADYIHESPPDPPLSDDDAAWAAGVLADAGLTPPAVPRPESA